MTIWSIPRTFTAGMVGNAADFNTYISNDLKYLKDPAFGRTALNPTAVANVSTTSTVFTAITAAASITLTTYGSPIRCGLAGVIATNSVLLAFEVDGVIYTGQHPSGIYKAEVGSFNINDWISDITASGAHVIRPAWRVGAGTNTGQLMCSGAPAIFWAREG
jgi:hypothetical protein